MIAQHGNVSGRQARSHPAYRRYVALLDVLGMKDWLERDPAQVIAEHLDAALVACDQSSSGSLDARSYGPLISTVHFSDCLLAWSPDDSWASLATICSAVKMIVIVALQKGVPLRGAISVGEVVCNRATQRFVGNPIADAYLWSERKPHPYSSVGVDLTPSALSDIGSRLTSAPIPPHWDSDPGGLPGAVFERNREASDSLVWYQDRLFINHWGHGVFAHANPRELFLMRGLPLKEDSERKMRDMEAFFATTKEVERRYADQDWRRRVVAFQSSRDHDERLVVATKERAEEQERTLKRYGEYFDLERIAAARAGDVHAAR